MNDQKNMILFLVVAVGILLGWEALYGGFAPKPQPATEQTGQTGGTTPAGQTTGQSNGSGAPIDPALGAEAQPQPTAQPAPADTKAEIAAGQRIEIRNGRLSGSLLLRGALIDEVTLTDYTETLEPDSPKIELLFPRQSNSPYFVRHGWTGTGTAVPGLDTEWTADGTVLSPESPVTLTWDNGEGVIFKRKISLDENYMFAVEQTVENTGTAPLVLRPYASVNRITTPQTQGFYILHEGPMGVIGGSLHEVDYEDLQDQYETGQEEGKAASDSGTVEQTTGGWVGITDKYWLTAVLPDQSQPVTMHMFNYKSRNDEREKYQADFVGGDLTVEPGESATFKSHAFVGAKRLSLLDGYEKSLGVANFDLAIDFGWFYFMTKPIFQGLLWLSHHVHNMGIAILIMTLGIKIILFPLTNKSYKAMSRMKALQPKLVELRERFGEDKMRFNQEMMGLYKKEKVNPASGCLPILVQIPVFFALYKVLYVNIEMRHAPFFGWIKDLSAVDPTNIFTLFGLIPWSPPDFLHLGIWPLIMGFTMWLQQQLNPKPTDNVQAQMMKWFPFIFTFLLASFPAGLVIYWAWNNALSIAQQWLIMKRMGVKAG